MNKQLRLGAGGGTPTRRPRRAQGKTLDPDC